MKPYSIRKLFLYYDSPASTATAATNDSSSSSSSSSSSPPSSSKKLSQLHNPPFDSSMALTIVVLLTALFFMGFFSIYIRRTTENPNAHLSRRRRYRGGSPLDSFLFPSDHHHHRGPGNSGKGLDPTTVRSLPVYSYHGNAKYQMDCAICLSEFEDEECVKTIPSCKHIFHVECIDTWLSSHVSCPVCRRTRLFEIKGGGDCSGSDHTGVMQDRSDSQSSTIEISDTCMVMGTTSRMRRTKSCSSSIRQPEAILQRTLSL